MNTPTYFKKLLVGIFAVTVLLVLTGLLPTAGATPAKTRILILPFTLLEQSSSSSELAGDLHRIFQDIFDRDPQIETVSDPENVVTEQTFDDSELLQEGKDANVSWVIAGEFQGNAEGWELFLRVLDPKEGISRPSSLQGTSIYVLEKTVEDWVANHREFLLTTDLKLRAQYEKELRHQEAMKYYNQALQLKAQDSNTLTRKVSLLKKAIQIDSEFSSPHLSLGLAYQLQKKYPEAEKAYKKAIELQPDFHTAYYNLGTLYQALKNWKKAEESYRTAVDIYPNYREAWHNLGIVLGYNANGESFGVGFDSKGAIAAFNKAIAVNPDSLDSYVALGICYQNTKEYQLSQEVYEEAIRRNDRYELAWYNLALLLDSFIGDYPEAIRCYEKYISLGGQRSEGARNRIKYLQNLMFPNDTLQSPSESPDTVSP